MMLPDWPKTYQEKKNSTGGGIGLKHNLNDIRMYYKLSHGCYPTGQKHTRKEVADTAQAVPRNWTEAQLVDIGMYYKLSHGCYLTGQKKTPEKTSVADTAQAVPRSTN